MMNFNYLINEHLGVILLRHGCRVTDERHNLLHFEAETCAFRFVYEERSNEMTCYIGLRFNGEPFEYFDFNFVLAVLYENRTTPTYQDVPSIENEILLLKEVLIENESLFAGDERLFEKVKQLYDKAIHDYNAML